MLLCRTSLARCVESMVRKASFFECEECKGTGTQKYSWSSVSFACPACGGTGLKARYRQ